MDSAGVTARTSDERDADTMAAQLGRTPRGDVTVVSRCSNGAPQVIQTSPVLADGSPFPTLYWLTCPVLNQAVARLEGDGVISEIQARFDADSGLLDELAAASRSYARARDGASTPGATGIGGASSRPTTGIGGAADPAAVKCLHAHYAHYLATGENPVGRIVAGMLDTPDPDRERLCDNCGF